MIPEGGYSVTAREAAGLRRSFTSSGTRVTEAVGGYSVGELSVQCGAMQGKQSKAKQSTVEQN